MAKDWTSDSINQLTLLWNEGNSASHIAGIMGRTRNSVIGKVFRLKLPQRLNGKIPSMRNSRKGIAKPRKKYIQKYSIKNAEIRKGLLAKMQIVDISQELSVPVHYISRYRKRIMRDGDHMPPLIKIPVDPKQLKGAHCRKIQRMEQASIPKTAINIMDISLKTCKWPVGAKSGGDQMFCGEDKPETGSPYCQTHRLIGTE